MGARINYVFDDGSNALTVLYSHYGEYSWQDDLAGALEHAQPRKGDYSYFTRMIISYLIKDAVLEETGFGIFALTREELSDLFDKVVVLDLANNIIIDCDTQEQISFYYGKVMA